MKASGEHTIYVCPYMQGRYKYHRIQVEAGANSRQDTKRLDIQFMYVCTGNVSEITSSWKIEE